MYYRLFTQDCTLLCNFCCFQELHSVTGQVQELKSQKQKLQDELEQLRLDLERRMAEVSTECRNAVTEKVKNMDMKLAKETGKAKRMKRQLARERSKRKRMELKLASEKRKGERMGKKNKKLCKVKFLPLSNFNLLIAIIAIIYKCITVKL